MRGWGEQRGQVLPLGALFMAFLLGMSALTLGVGSSALAQTQEQRGADAMVLAGAEAIQGGDTETEATTEAETVLVANSVPVSDVTLQYLNSADQTTSTASDVAFVRAVVTKSTNLPFGELLGRSSDQITVHSEAKVGNTGPACGLCVLSATQSEAVNVSGSGSIVVKAGAIDINSSASNALYASGSADITAPSINVVGGKSTSGSVTISPAPTLGASPISDPLAGFAAPALTTPNQGAVTVSNSNSETIFPGLYTSITVEGSGSLTMEPGTYVLTGGFQLEGSGKVKGSGVSIYLTCSGYSSTDTEPCAGASGGSFSSGGSTQFDLTAPTSGDLQGIVLATDPRNTSSMTMEGSASDVLDGTVYAPSSAVTVEGSGGATTLDSIFIVSSITVSGSGTVDLASTEQSNAPAVYDGGIPQLSE